VVDTPATRRAARYAPAVDDGWGPATSVYAGSASGTSYAPGRPAEYQPDGRYEPAAPELRARHGEPTGPNAEIGRPARRAAVPERGLPAWAAVLVLLVIAGIGGIIDAVSGTTVRGGFNIGIIVASIIAIILVRRSAMFPVVVAPPIVYAGASAAMLYVRSDGLRDRSALFDAATNWLVYGFPALAGATAAVLIIAGIRLITHR
jgi:hypothetical protein